MGFGAHKITWSVRANNVLQTGLQEFSNQYLENFSSMNFLRRRSRSPERRRSRSVDRQRRFSPVRFGGYGGRRGVSPFRRRSPPRRDTRRSRTPPYRRRRGRSSSSSDSESDRDRRRRAAAEKKMKMFGYELVYIF